jgi:hypothetical protein|tara:strand:- start:562 stop:855 length:294 start_codon:yes stop_codon:yes gene_type:complete
MRDVKINNTINLILRYFRSYSSQNLLDKNVKNLSHKNFPDRPPEEAEKNNSVSIKDVSNNVINKNRIKHLTTDENKVVVQVIRDESGKIIITVHLNE